MTNVARLAQQKDIPICRLGDRIGDLRRRLGDTGWQVCVVTDDEQAVAGLIHHESSLNRDSEASVESVMISDPPTIGPDASSEEATEFMARHNLDSILVTTSDGRLVGVLQRQYGEEAVAESDKHKRARSSTRRKPNSSRSSR